MFNKEIVSKEVIRLTINFLKSSECFIQPLFWPVAFVLTFSIHLFFLSIYLFFLLDLIVQGWLLVIISYLSSLCCFFHSFMYYFSYLLSVLLLVLVMIIDIYLYKKMRLIRCKQIIWEKLPQPMKSTSWEKWIWSFNTLNLFKIAFYICFVTKFEHLWSQEAMMNQWDHSETIDSGWIRFHALVSSETHNIHIISFRNSALSILIKIYLRSSLLPSSNEDFEINKFMEFFATGRSHWSTALSVRSITLSQIVSGIYDICNLLFFFSVIVIFNATLFCGHFNNSSFTYSNVTLLINCLWVCGTFHLRISTIIKLRHKITYGNREAVNTTEQSFRIT